MLVKDAIYTVEGVVGQELVRGYSGQVRALEPTPGRSTPGLIDLSLPKFLECSTAQGARGIQVKEGLKGRF